MRWTWCGVRDSGIHRTAVFQASGIAVRTFDSGHVVAEVAGHALDAVGQLRQVQPVGVGLRVGAVLQSTLRPVGYAAPMETQMKKAANGAYTDRGTPHGYTSLTPHLVVSPASAALDFYQEVYGAQVLDVTRGGELIMHAVLQFRSGCMTLSDPLEGYGLVAPDGKSTTMSLALYVEDADAVVEAAVQAGATIREPLTHFVSGDRYASLIDPFGVRWAIMTRVEDLSFEQSASRVAKWAKHL